MSDLEAVGALVTAGLAASELDGDKGGRAAPAAPHGACANCKAALTGPYCVACGQSAHIHRSLLHLAEEVVHGILHFDAKGWKTIPLLVAFPGRLTRRYIDGQRKNYVSPLALFLFMVFLSFFAASVFSDSPGGHGSSKTPATRAEVRQKLVEQLAIADTEFKRAQSELAKAVSGKSDQDDAKDRLSEARSDQASAQRELRELDASVGLPAPIEAGNVLGMSEEKRQALIARLKAKSYDISHPALYQAAKHGLENPELMLYKLKNTTYKFSFMLIPISLPFLWLMFFWKRGVVMYDHAVFVLYSLCFMSLLFVTILALAHFELEKTALVLAMLAPPAHMFMQLRGTYSLSVFSALWRTVMLLFAAVIVTSTFIVFVALMTMR